MVGRILSLTLLAIVVALSACAPASPTAAPPAQTAIPIATQARGAHPCPTETGAPTPTETIEPSPVATPQPTSTPASLTPTPLPTIRASCYPDASAPLDDLVVLRGPEHQFDPSCEVSGGVGEITASWDIDGDGTAESEEADPPPLALQPGEYNPVVTFTDEAGQSLTVQLARIVKVGPPRYPDWRYGVHAHIVLGEGPYAAQSSAEIERELQLIEDAGIQFVKLDFKWDFLEPDAGQYDFYNYDRLVQLVRERGLGIFAVVSFSPRWASSGSGDSWRDWVFDAPKNPRHYGRFFSALVDRYGDYIKVWEVWQEPNCSLYFRSADPEQYIAVLMQGYLSAKYADPTSIVGLGSLANYETSFPGVVFRPPEEFLQSIYDAGGKGHFDFVDRHPYPRFDQRDPTQVLDYLDSTRTVMMVNGDEGIGMAVSEIGIPSFSTVSEGDVAASLPLILDAILSRDYVWMVSWYNLRDKGADPDDPEHHFGLVRRDWSIKPAYVAYGEFIRSH